MSWSISASGPKAEALATIAKQVSEAYYKPGTPEGDDIVAAHARIEALAASLATSDTVRISAYGSHSVSDGGIVHAELHVSVDAV